MKEKAVLTTGDVAAHCHVSYETVMNWIKSGKLKAHKTPGGHHRIPARDFSAFLEEYNMPLPEIEPVRRKVLVVDDDPGLVSVIVEFFDNAGEYELATASDGFAAGIQVVKFCPDLIVLDLMMPNIDGFEVCKSLKSNPETQQVLILVITGYAEEENIQKALACGADYCMAKPFRIAELKKKVDELFAGESRRADPASQSA